MLRTFASSLARGRFYPTLLIYLVAFSLVTSLIQLPLSYYVGYVREHAFGLSTQHLSKWIGDQVKGALVGLVIGALILWLPYLLLARSPSHWWLWTGVLSLPLIVIMFLVTPIWIAPLFNKFGPMQDKALEADVLATASRAGVEGARVFQVDKSVDTEKVNAYVTGIGNTKRIVLWDTLLDAPVAAADPLRRRSRARALRARPRRHQHLRVVGADSCWASTARIAPPICCCRASAAASGSPSSRTWRRCRC